MRIRNERRRMFMGLAALVAAIALTQPALGQKIDPRVVERAQSEAAVPVFIVLSHQPQREILERADGANALYRQVAESRYRQAAERALGGVEELRQARENAEAVVLRTRQQAFQAIGQAIGPEQDTLEGRLRGLGATRISRYLGINMLSAEIPASAIAALEADPQIARVFPVEKQYPQLATSVPALGAPAFWNAGYTGQGESVGILDSGIKTNHPAFAGVPIVSQVFLANGSTDSCFADDASVQDDQGHGTHVAGIVASQGSAGWTNYQGVAKGIGTLYNLKVAYKVAVSSGCPPFGAESQDSDVMAALDWAVRNTSLKIFNYSYGSPATAEDDDFTRSLDQYMDTYGLTIAIAAGNYGPGDHTVSSPGIAYNAITVGNWVSRGVMNDTSSRGPTYGNYGNGRNKPDLAAPGTSIYSTAYDWDTQPGTGNDFVSQTGTSMAAPHIAGAAALIESAGVADPLAVKALLINTADSSGGWQSDSGWGYTNLTTAQGQLYYQTGSLASGDSQLYRASADGAFRATAVWNRHWDGTTSYLNSIALHLYAADTGVELANSTATPQSVEQVSATYPGDVIVWATMTSGWPPGGVSSEPYAIAFSGPGAPIQASNPSIHLTCSPPPMVASGAQVAVSCEVSNTGGLPAGGSTGQAVISDGVSSPVTMAFGDIQPGSVSSRTFNLTAPYAAGTYGLRIDVSTAAFLGSSDTNSLTVTVSQALTPTVLVSPGNGASGVSATPTLSWSPVSGATSYAVYLGTSVAPPLAGNTNGTSYVPGALSPGTLYYWRIVASNGNGGSSSATWSFTTQGSASGPVQYVIATVAGTSNGGFSGDGGPALDAVLGAPEAVAQDAAGNLYIADTNRVREVTPDGTIHTLAGTGNCSYPFHIGDGGPAQDADICDPEGVATDGAGNVYISDKTLRRIRKVDRSGIITTVAGTSEYGSSGDGGPAISAKFMSPVAIALDAAGNLYIGDTYDFRVRKIDAHGIISTFAGTGTGGYSGDGGPANSAELSEPRAIAADGAGNVYIADSSNNRVRKVAPDGTITTVAGDGTQSDGGDGGPAVGAQVSGPEGLAVDATGNLFIADGYYSVIREVTLDGKIRTVAGTGSNGPYWAAGPATSIPLLLSLGITVGPSGNLYIAETYRNVVRVMRPADPSCQSQLSQSTFVVSGFGDTIPVSLQTASGCTWAAVGLPDWITVAPTDWTAHLGFGPANFNLVVAANFGDLRGATISIGGAAVEVTQGATGSCFSYALSPGSATATADGGPGTFGVTTGPGCVWTVSGGSDWATLTSPSPSIGSGNVNYTVARNTGEPRSATFTIAGLPFNIQQAGIWGSGLRFVPVTPCRIADTRSGSGAMGTAETRSFAIPQSGCGIPSTAQAYSLNVTVVPRGPLSYLTLWPTGQNQPFVSTLNSFGGLVVANAAIVPAGLDGAVSVYVTDPTDVILDIDGYFDSAGTYAFYPVQPCRVADTRNPAGPFGAPALTGAESRDFPVPSSGCGLPASASAYSMNVTVVPAGYLGYLKTWPTGQAQPNVSTLNSWTGKVVANAAIVPAGTGGSISVYAEDPTQVVLDTNGYFGAPGGAGALTFYSVAPCRVADTRGDRGTFGGPEMGDAETRSFPIPSSGCGIPATVAAYSLNVTAVPEGMLEYLTVWPTGAGQPFASTLNSWDGAVVANAAIVPAGAGGAISVFVANRTHVILDINGYFAP